MESATTTASGMQRDALNKEIQSTRTQFFVTETQFNVKRHTQENQNLAIALLKSPSRRPSHVRPPKLKAVRMCMNNIMRMTVPWMVLAQESSPILCSRNELIPNSNSRARRLIVLTCNLVS